MDHIPTSYARTHFPEREDDYRTNLPEPASNIRIYVTTPNRYLFKIFPTDDVPTELQQPEPRAVPAAQAPSPGAQYEQYQSRPDPGPQYTALNVQTHHGATVDNSTTAQEQPGSDSVDATVSDIADLEDAMSRLSISHDAGAAERQRLYDLFLDRGPEIFRTVFANNPPGRECYMDWIREQFPSCAPEELAHHSVILREFLKWFAEERQEYAERIARNIREGRHRGG